MTKGFKLVEPGSAEHKALMLNPEERAELRAMNAAFTAGEDVDLKRYSQLRTRVLMWGDADCEPQSFVGLEPRYAIDPAIKRREGDSNQSIWFVSYGEEMQDQRAVRAAKPSRWRRLKWALEWRAQAVIDFAQDAWHIVREHKGLFANMAMLWFGGFLMGFGLRGLLGV